MAAPGLTADQLANIGNVMGGNFNANTRESLTQYLYTVPAEDLDVALHIEAVRMQGVLDLQRDWSEERGAIEQEVAQDLSNPGYVLYERLRSIAFAGTPYEHDALGTRPSFDKTSARMLKDFHDVWYAPNNAILVVVGDLEPQAALAKIKDLFGDIQRKALPAAPKVMLQPLKATSFTVPTDRPNGTLMIAVRTPGLDSPDFPALEVLADVLSSKRFDLYGLVPQGKALDAEFSLDPLPQAGLAYATVSFAAAADPKSLELTCAPFSRRSSRRAFRPSSSMPRKCRSGVRRSFRRIPLLDWLRSGPTPSHSTVSPHRPKTWRESRRSPSQT